MPAAKYPKIFGGQRVTLTRYNHPVMHYRFDTVACYHIPCCDGGIVHDFACVCNVLFSFSNR